MPKRRKSSKRALFIAKYERLQQRKKKVLHLNGIIQSNSYNSYFNVKENLEMSKLEYHTTQKERKRFNFSDTDMKSDITSANARKDNPQAQEEKSCVFKKKKFIIPCGIISVLIIVLTVVLILLFNEEIDLPPNISYNGRNMSGGKQQTFLEIPVPLKDSKYAKIISNPFKTSLIEEQFESFLREISKNVYDFKISLLTLCQALCSRQGTSVNSIPEELENNPEELAQNISQFLKNYKSNENFVIEKVDSLWMTDVEYNFEKEKYSIAKFEEEEQQNSNEAENQPMTNQKSCSLSILLKDLYPFLEAYLKSRLEVLEKEGKKVKEEFSYLLDDPENEVAEECYVVSQDTMRCQQGELKKFDEEVSEKSLESSVDSIVLDLKIHALNS